MATKHPELKSEHIEFIKEQKIYFVGTAADEGNINVSPKGFDSLRVMSSSRVVWRNMTGSGNETAAHLEQNDRMTLMFCAFDGRPLILRLYGKATAVHPRHEQWDELSALFPETVAARQYVDLKINLVLTSCGFGVPFYEYQNDRDNMDKWIHVQGEEGIKKYWEVKNQRTIDDKPTYIFEDKDN